MKLKYTYRVILTLFSLFFFTSETYARLILPKNKPLDFISETDKKNTPKFLTEIKEEKKEVKQVTKKEESKIKKNEKKIVKKEDKNLITEKNKNENTEEFSITNTVFPLKKPSLETKLNKKSNYLSEKDFVSAQKIFSNIKLKRWETALKELNNTNDKTLKKLVTWLYLKEPNNNASFYEYFNFINLNKDWPRINRLRYLAEHKIDNKNIKESDILVFFKNQPPLSGYGKIILGEVFLKQGKIKEAEKLILEGFLDAELSSKQLKDLQKKYSSILNSDQVIKRAFTLAWTQDPIQLRPTLLYLPKNHKELYEARFALMTRSYGVDKAISKVPKVFENDVGLNFDRAKWRRKRGRYDGALDIINSAPKDPILMVKPDLWFQEKLIIARKKIDKKQFAEAYDILNHHGVLETGLLAEAEWHLGWLALRFLNKPKEAIKHFTIMYNKISYPISKSRAAYWLARAYEQNSEKTNANNWYETASQYTTTFYGQLAYAKIKKNDFKIKNNYNFSEENFNKFLKNDLSKAVLILSELEKTQYSKDIIRFLGNEDATNEQKIFAAKLSQKVNRLDYAIQISKEASYKNINFLELNYPVIETPSKVNNVNSLPKEVILAIIRQESEFDSKADSWAGAKGLMQVMPRTAQIVSKQAGLSYSREKLTSDELFNIKLGVYYISTLNQELDNTLYMSFAAYNAGPHRVKKWIKRFGDPRKNQIDPIDWIELIPFNETRNYIQRVMENVLVYKYVLEKKPIENNIEKIIYKKNL